MCLAAQNEEAVHFSHKRHAPLKIECVYCHSTAETAERAGFPGAARCMTCHRAVKRDSQQIRHLAAMGNEAKPFPTHQVYTVEDFVFFSHARHHARGIECRECHGVVWERDVITKEVPTTMKACVDCHKSHRAAIACNTCHELGQ
jgi:hypothetical protein